MNKEKFKSMLADNGSSYSKLAKMLGVTKRTVYRKTLKNQFYINELRCVKEIFNLSDDEFLNIFFR